MIEIAVTPNRPDCLGVRGIARDLAAAGLGTLEAGRRSKPVKGSFANPDRRSSSSSTRTAPQRLPGLRRRAMSAASRTAPSPAWLQQRLKAIGLRPINALVDITNYIAYDRGRPLHVYDADKLERRHPRAARRARASSSWRSTARPTRSTPTCASSPTTAPCSGFGGVMGGEETGVTEATTNVFIELAYFDPMRTARTGRKLGIQSDARFRFERGVDPDFVVPGLELATRAGARALRRRGRARSRSPASRRSRTRRSTSISAWSSA